MSLQQLIREGNYATAQEAFEAITAASEIVTDDQLYTWAGVALLVGPVGAESLRVALEQNGMGWVVHQLGGTGIQLSNKLVQQALMGFTQANLPGADILAAQGVSTQAPWQVDGLASEPTLEQVEKAFIVERTRKQMAAILRPIQAKSTALNAWLDSLDTSTKTVAEVQTYCDALLASEGGNP